MLASPNHKNAKSYPGQKTGANFVGAGRRCRHCRHCRHCRCRRRLILSNEDKSETK